MKRLLVYASIDVKNEEILTGDYVFYKEFPYLDLSEYDIITIFGTIGEEPGNLFWKSYIETLPKFSDKINKDLAKSVGSLCDLKIHEIEIEANNTIDINKIFFLDFNTEEIYKVSVINGLYVISNCANIDDSVAKERENIDIMHKGARNRYEEELELLKKKEEEEIIKRDSETLSALLGESSTTESKVKIRSRRRAK